MTRITTVRTVCDVIKTALSLKKDYTHAISLYRRLKNTHLLIKIRQKHRKDFLKNRQIGDVELPMEMPQSIGNCGNIIFLCSKR